MQTLIRPMQDQRTLRFAARTLREHLARVGSAAPTLATAGATPSADFLFQLELTSPNAGDTEPDWFAIEPLSAPAQGLRLHGPRGRCVLYAVYYVLETLGFQWLRPGERGVVIPPTISYQAIADLYHREQATYPFRTICIEGACALEHVLDMIDWMPTRRFNAYFIQFDLGMAFFQRWYEHQWHGRGHSPYLQPEPKTQQQIRAFIEQIEQAVLDRGLILEKVGHGWTCAALGLPAEGWHEASDQAIPEDKRHWLAEVDGRRAFWDGVPLNTNLDYANPDVRRAMIHAIVEYVQTHTQVDRIHVWLADAGNNHDEGRPSQQARPSDFYVMLLNGLDEALRKIDSPVRVVCLAYLDLLWPPIREQIHHPDRFILMYAPITRSFQQAFTEEADVATPGPFHRNQLRFPTTFHEGLTLLRGWQKQLPHQAFDFDYHLMWAPFFDPAQFTLAKTLHGDLRALHQVALHGLNSCQVQRLGFPHSLLLEVLGQGLWRPATPFAQIVAKTFHDAFGGMGLEVAAVFEQMSELWRPFFAPVYDRPVGPDPSAAKRVADQEAIHAGLANLPRLHEARDQLEALSADPPVPDHEAQQWSWRYLQRYTEVLAKLLPAFEAYLKADSTVQQHFDDAIDFLWRIEPEIHPHLDVYEAALVLQRRVDEVLAYRASRPNLTG